MQTGTQNAEQYDFRQYDQVWRRVGPQLEPYPDAAAQSPQVPQPAGAARDGAARGGAALTARQEAELPGAVPAPCCMGTAALELLDVLEGYIEQELEEQRTYQALARTAPAWARGRLREIGAEEGRHARRLMAVHFLITGSCYRPAVPAGCVQPGSWCAALRSRYHAEACGGLNYARSAEGTADPCLARLLDALSADEYRHADALLAMLERTLHRGA